MIQTYESNVKKGNLLKRNGNFQLAVDVFRETLNLARKKRNKDIECGSLMSLGLLYWNLGDLKKSSKSYKNALFLAKELNLKEREEECKDALEIYRLYLEGKKYRSQRQLQKSIKSFRRAISLADAIESREHKLKCLRQLSLTYWEFGQLQEFFSLNQEALGIAKDLNHKKERGKSLIHIGLFYWKLDNYSKALSYYEEAMSIARNLGDKLNESACLNNISIIYMKIGKYDKALTYLAKALKAYQQQGDNLYISMTLNNIGEAYRNKGLTSAEKEDFFRALDNFKECLKLSRKAGDRKTEMQVLNNIGSVHVELKNYDDALNYFQMANEIAKEVMDREGMGMILNNIGNIYSNQSKCEDAISSYKKAINIVHESSEREILWEAYFGLGKCCESRNEFSEAVIWYKKAINMIDHIRSQIYLDIHKSGFVRDKLKIYESLINLLYKLSSVNFEKSFAKEAFHIVERAKARAFLESLRESKIDIRESLTPELKKWEHEISGRISLILHDLSKANLPEKKKKELLEQLQREEDQYIGLLSKVRVEIPEIATLVSPKPCYVEQVQRLISNENTALIEYFLGEEQSFVFVITRNEFDLHPLPSRSEIEKSTKAYLRILCTPPKGKFRGVLAAKRIYKELLFPVEKILSESIDNLIIVPDGVLYYLPFESLMPCIRSNLRKREYLISNYTISYSPSASSLLFLLDRKSDKGSQKKFLAFGNPSYDFKVSSKKRGSGSYTEVLKELYMSQGFDFSPLPYSKNEILNISKYFPEKKGEIYLNSEAKEEVVKKLPLRDYQIIHFACHGFLDEKFPYRSALVLTLNGDPHEDGFLQVHEIYNLRINANLVVLSACQTGRGKLERAEGILGFPRIFFYAGAKSVVSTLWEISDISSAEFMRLFYRYLSRGHNKTQALRLSKLRMMKSKFHHPFYWGAFVLNGDYSSKIIFR